MESSATSTTSYPAGREPSSGELKKKILDRMKCFTYVNRLIEPSTDLIDPDDWGAIEKRFSRNKTLLFTPNRKLHRTGIPIDGVSLFELYSIVITKLDPIRRFSAIYMLASNTDQLPLIVYKRPTSTSDEDIINSPLPIKNIFYLPEVCYPIMFALSNPRTWSWYLCNMMYPEDLEYGIVQSESFKDEYTDSEAVISYELVKSAVVAELSFLFVFEDGKVRPINIFAGSLYATTDGNMDTKRMIQDFSKQMQFKSNEALQVVNRSVFAVPMGSSLVVHFDLVVNYNDLGMKDYLQGSPVVSNPKTNTNIEDNDFFQGSLEFSVPTITSSEERCLSSFHGSAKITMKVNWRDYFV